MSAEISFYRLDVISFACVVLAVFIFAEVLKQIFLALFFGYSNQHFSVSFMTVFQITLISIKDKGTLSIDEITTKIINSNETIYTKIALSTDKKECVLISETTPIKSSKYCSEEYLPYLQIDDFDGYVSSYAKGNQEEFNACLESLFD